MEEAPTPNINTNKSEKFSGIALHQDDIYQVDFITVNKAIMIKCYNTDDNNKNDIYSYKLTEDEIIKTCGDYSTFINKLKANASGILGIEKFNNSLLLTIFSDEEKTKKLFILSLKKFNEEDEIDEDNINNLQEAIKIIKYLIKENKKLKKDFEDYKEKMDLNFLYNSFDSGAYKLDAIYNNLSSKDIIQNKHDFCLINQGIQHLFKKNIVVFESIYKSENLKFNDKIFDEMFQNSEYSILIILTQDKKRFGAFFKRNDKKGNNINNNVMGINNLNGQQMNMPPGNLYMQMNNQGNNINNNGMGINNLNGPQMNMSPGNLSMKMNNINNFNVTKVIFNSSLSAKNYYVFSFDSGEIFYSNNNLGNNIIPSFSIELSGRILIVKENPLTSIGYKLNGTQQSNIMEIELYTIQYGSL